MIFELAVNGGKTASQQLTIALDQPENVWKAFIDFEVSTGSFQKANYLFERLISKTKHIKVWLGYAWHMLD